MDSIVLELQRNAVAKDADVSELVRMALVVARKLHVTDFDHWSERELKGYGNEPLPDYRIVEAELKAHNPYHGWVPCLFEDARVAKAAAEASCNNSIGELQHMLANPREGFLHLPLSHELTLKLMRGAQSPLVPTRLISLSTIAGIVDAVRNIVLDWSLKLEESGILGEGLTFSAKEKERAASAINIETFHGILGDVHAAQLQIGDYNSIENELERVGIPEAARNELKTIVDEYNAARGAKKQSLAKRGLAWVAKHAKTIGALAKVIAAWFGS